MYRGAKDLILPPEFSGPAQLLLYTRYGDPRTPGWGNKWLFNWKVGQLHPWFPVEEVRIHKHFWPLLREAFLELESFGLHKEITTFNLCYQVSHLLDSPILSVHSWGAAIDMNAEENPTGSMGAWSDDFIQVMMRNNIYCGQNWTGVKEPMHFSMVNG